MALQAGIAGTGLIGKVHACSLRLAGAELAGVAASTRESASAATNELGAADGLRAALVTEAVLVSSRSGQWVDVEPVREPQAVAS
jgi:prephenate dehydrogenase